MIFVLVLKIESITDRKICNGKNSRWILLKLDSLPNRKIATAFTQQKKQRTPECMQSDVFIFAKQNKNRKSARHFHQTAMPIYSSVPLNVKLPYKSTSTDDNGVAKPILYFQDSVICTIFCTIKHAMKKVFRLLSTSKKVKVSFQEESKHCKHTLARTFRLTHNYYCHSRITPFELKKKV